MIYFVIELMYFNNTQNILYGFAICSILTNTRYIGIIHTSDIHQNKTYVGHMREYDPTAYYIKW